MSQKIKLAIPFHINNSYNDKVTEFNIRYTKDLNDFDKLIEFINEFPDMRINIEMPQGVHVKTLATLSKLSDKIYARLFPQDLPRVEEMREEGIKFFFDSSLPVYSYPLLDDMREMGVTDIYIADDLVYNLPNVREYCDKHNLKIRLVLNRIPSTALNKGKDPASFIFKPEDIDTLDAYIDTYEFDCGEPYQWNIFGVLYETWFLNKYWHGNLREINPDLLISVENDNYLPMLTTYKIRCNRKCTSIPSSFCNKCFQFNDIASILTDKNVRITV